MSSNLPEETTKLDPRVKRTRSLIEQAFMDLLAEKGFQSINVQDIAARAGINRATFYAHFQDKYALLDHSIREAFRRELEKNLLDVCTFSTENLRRLIEVVCEFIGGLNSHCPVTDHQFQTLIETQIRTQVYELILHWLEDVEGYRDVAARERAATAASWAIYGLAHERSHSKSAIPAGEFAGQVLPIVAANLNPALAVV